MLYVMKTVSGNSGRGDALQSTKSDRVERQKARVVFLCRFDVSNAACSERATGEA